MNEKKKKAVDEVLCDFEITEGKETREETYIQDDCELGKVSIIEDLDGRKIVLISDIRFKGKRRIKWNDVEMYLKEYIGTCYEIAETAEKIFIGADFPSEFSGSEDTVRLKGTAAKAKANAVAGLPELIEIAGNVRYQENYKEKHCDDAKNGWYRYTTYFALPVYNQLKDVDRYNVFRIEMLIRHDKDGKKYLYDMVNIKKETSTPPRQNVVR